MSNQNKIDLFLKSLKISENTIAEEWISSLSDTNVNIPISQQRVTSLLERKSKKMKNCKYDPSYLAFGFTYKYDYPFGNKRPTILE